ncbi:hypothetical protein F7725_003353 [Dissostichus mawsoni]|uniref:Peripheral myelin protein 22 n=1 Tax=Dissostichus mawsoni TaxID=36200 RepID=A0A7J5YA30_DISMA|nr:hypothetical protein F7725_003353 [Dissostichus mawsoni]
MGTMDSTIKFGFMCQQEAVASKGEGALRRFTIPSYSHKAHITASPSIRQRDSAAAYSSSPQVFTNKTTGIHLMCQKKREKGESGTGCALRLQQLITITRRSKQEACFTHRGILGIPQERADLLESCCSSCSECLLCTSSFSFFSSCRRQQTWSVGGDRTTDLWYTCTNSNGGYHCKPAISEDWLQAVQALMILSLLFCFFSLIAFLFQLFKLVKGGRFFFTAIFQILASVFVMCAAIIYTVMSPDDGIVKFGYAYVLAWVSFPLTLISGLIYIVLRKKE